MRQQNKDTLIRLFFANHGKADGIGPACHAPLPGSHPSDDSLVTVGLEISQISKVNNDVKDFFDAAKTKHLSMAEMSSLLGSFNFPEKSDKTPQRFTARKETKNSFASCRVQSSSPHRFQFRRVLVFLCLVFTLGIISHSPLPGVEEVSEKQREEVETSLGKKHSGQIERWNKALAGFENPFSYLFDE